MAIAAHDDLGARLSRLLDANLPGACDIRVENLAPITAGNAREAWSFEIHWLEHGRRRNVSCVMLRKAGAGQLETDMTREFEVVRSLQDSGVPVARALWIDRDGRWLERQAFIMEKVAGVSDLPPLLKPEGAERSRALAIQMSEIAARLHNIDWQPLAPCILPAAAPENAAIEQVAYWESLFLKHRMEPHPVMTAAFIWLKEHAPAANRVCIVHGDFRFGNFLYEGARINAMLDWEMVHLGDPAEDIAWAYRSLWAPQSYLPIEEFIRRYTALSGIRIDPDKLLYYRLLGEVKHSIISLTGARSFMDGRTRNLFMADRAAAVTGYLRQFMDWLPE
jgi:aminoglycoside phosphotransferase (APT) family kinase protein